MAQRKIWLTTLALTIGLIGLAIPALSAEDAKDAPPADEAANDVLDVSALAYQTADFGHEHGSPESLLAAAVMLHSLKFAKTTPITDLPTDDAGKPITEKSLENKSFDDEANDLFDEAEAMALDMKIPGFAAIIKAAKSRETRGLRGGAKTLRRKIGPRKTEVFHFEFAVGKNAPYTFHASKPLSLKVVHREAGDTWTNGTFRQYHHGNPGRVGGRGKEKYGHVTFTIHNPNKKPAEYTLSIK